MTIDQINQPYTGANNYPNIVRNLIAVGIESYTVDAATDVTVYGLAGGEKRVRFTEKVFRPPAFSFDPDDVKSAIAINQKGESDYHQFMDHIARAGARFYEATLNGENRRVEYFGLGASRVEAIPL